MATRRIGWIAVLAMTALPACASAQIDQKMRKVDGARWLAGSYETTCDRIGAEGVVIFQVFSTEKNEQSALREARRNAVRAMVFRGLSTGRCNEPPLVRQEQITDEVDRYFDTFFKEGGQYLSYVQYAGDEVESKVKVGKQVKIQSTVVVQRKRLRSDLESAGIIKAMGDVFNRPPGYDR